MPDENQADSPPTDPKNQPIPQSPVTPPTPQQHKVRNDPDSRSEGEKDKAIHIEEDIRSGERWLIGISAASVILNAVIALIYYGQLKQMRISTSAAESAAKTADQTLKEIRASSTDTHALAVAAGTQANATKGVAQTAHESLVSTQRAIVTFAPEPRMLLIVGQHWTIDVPIENSGLTTTKGLRSSVNAEFFPDSEMPRDFSFPDDVGLNPSPIVLGPKSSIYTQPRNIPLEQITAITTNPSSHFYLWGWARYRDIFNNTPEHITEFCFELHVPALKLSGEPKFNVGLCRKHNCVDEECKHEK